MRFIGDTHGHVREYVQAIGAAPVSLQVGDFGVGFGFDEGLQNYLRNAEVDPDAHKFIRGNHDNVEECPKFAHFLEDGAHWRDDVMAFGGASSIDREYRVEGKSWWPTEQISDERFDQIEQEVELLGPSVIATHDAPESVARWMLHRLGRPYILEDSRTRRRLQEIWIKHQPDVWVFGHWHMSFNEIINGTRFVCLNIMETYDL